MNMAGAKAGDVVRIKGDPSLWLLTERIDSRRWRARLATRPNSTVCTSFEVEALWRKKR